MVVRQFMLPSDSLSNIVSLLSLVTHMRPDVSIKDTLDMDTVTHHTRDITSRLSFPTCTRTHTHACAPTYTHRGEMKGKLKLISIKSPDKQVEDNAVSNC